ncbi:hypothetical protein D8674_013048 [Pyrus ussuriensis x Pyrus communis]|uniref:Uncharacterized protein n=1 Tax=Pyrus ussuriensis x Pyrus communis TaxID=2448454 RepID=A0A5N5GNQ6_9ROSA|nr:hypothetical protein D8674_013048 [Pyrus ussuriensis x Pyrus communis]
MEMELSFVWLSSTLIWTRKGGKSEIIGMVQSIGDSSDRENDKTTNKNKYLG